jgi:aspartyl-tRNA(Asn)/glutamyl-tRNA(Gln) amidotransferase subunit A
VNELTRLPASILREHIAAKKVSPVELTDAVLARAEKLQPVLNCFITIAADHARAAARQAEQDVMQGKPLGLLHGIPFAAKDLVNTAGVRTTFGSLHHDENVPKDDAVAAARMKQAGAILFGKTTTPEFGHKALTDAPLFARAMPGAPSIRRAARAVARRSRWRPASARSASPPTAAARRAFPRRPTAWSD